MRAAPLEEPPCFLPILAFDRRAVRYARPDMVVTRQHLQHLPPPVRFDLAQLTRAMLPYVGNAHERLAPPIRAVLVRPGQRSANRYALLVAARHTGLGSPQQ